MTWAKRIYILINTVNKLFSFFSSWCFLKEIENMYSLFLSSYRSTRESLGELENAVETLACGSCSHSITRSPKLPLVFLQLNRNTVHVFYFLINMCPLWVPDVHLLVWVSPRLRGLTVRSFYFFSYFYQCFGGFGREIVETARHVHGGWQPCCFWLWYSDLI